MREKAMQGKKTTTSTITPSILVATQAQVDGYQRYHIRVQRSGLCVLGLSYNSPRCAKPAGLSCSPRLGVPCAPRRASSSSRSVAGSCGSNSPRNGDSFVTPINISFRGVTGVKGVN